MIIKKSIKTKIILSYILVGILLLITFAGIVDNLIYNKEKKQIKELVEKSLDRSYNAADLLIGTLYDYLFELYNEDPIIIDALYSQKYSDFRLYDIHKKLNDILKASPIIESIYIYNKNVNKIFSSISSVRSPEKFYEADILKLLKEYVEKDNNVFISRTIELRYTSQYDTSRDVITLIFTNATKGNDIQEAMIINISRDKLQNLINQSFVANNLIESFIIDFNGNIISNETANILKPDNEYHINKIIKNNNIEGLDELIINGERNIVGYRKSIKWGCLFVTVAKYENLLVNIRNMRMIILILSIIFIIISIIGVYYFTNGLYSPLYQLVQEINNLDYIIDREYPNEYKFLNTSIKNMKGKIEELQNRVTSYLPVTKNNMLHELIHGNLLIEDNYNKLIKNNNICLDGEFYLVVVLVIDSYSELYKNKSVEELVLYRNELTEMVLKGFEDTYDIEVIGDEFESISAIINLPEQNAYLKKISQVLKGIQEEFYKKQQLTFTVGIGTVVDTVKELNASYTEAIEASNYRINFGKGTIINQNDINSLDHFEYQYPYKLEKKIMDCLKLANKEELKRLLMEFTGAVSNFEYNQILLSFSQLELMTVRTAKNIIRNLSKELSISYIEIQKSVNECDTIQEIEELLFNKFCIIIDERKNILSSKNMKIIDKVKTYIDDNLSDESLSVEILADRVNLSSNYLRKIFKTTTGISVSNYLNQVRFEKAKELLVKTDYTAKKIAAMVGFQNSDYFYHAFKKHVGKTASNYRREQQRKQK